MGPRGRRWSTAPTLSFPRAGSSRCTLPRGPFTTFRVLMRRSWALGNGHWRQSTGVTAPTRGTWLRCCRCWRCTRACDPTSSGSRHGPCGRTVCVCLVFRIVKWVFVQRRCLFSVVFLHSTPHHTTPHHSTTHHSTVQYSPAQHSRAHHSTPHHTTPHHTTPHHTTPHHTTPHHTTSQHSTAQHSTAQHSAAQHSTAQHSTA